LDGLFLKYIVVSAASGVVASGLATFALREWISTRIKGSIQHSYDVKLETLRAQLKSEQDLAIVHITTTLAREAAFHAAAHTSFAEGQKATMERKLSGVDRLWSCVVQFRAALPQPFWTIMDVMTDDEYRAEKDKPSFQRLTGDLSTEELLEQFKTLLPDGIEEVRPYVGEYMWQLFYCYRALFVRILLMLKLRNVNPSHIEWHKDTGNRNLLTAVLTPQELNEFDNKNFGRASWLQSRLEAKILATSQKVISAEAFGAESLNQAWLIQQRIHELNRVSLPAL
jgi:hypothetical protein